MGDGEAEVEAEVEVGMGMGMEEGGVRPRTWASPSALMMLACFSCSALTTMNLERSASCCMTCFDSMAFANSVPNLRSVMETSWLGSGVRVRVRGRGRT